MAASDSREPPLEDGLERPPPSTRGISNGGAPIEKNDASTGEDEGDLLTDSEWVQMFKESLRGSSDFQQQKLRSGWQRSYRAFGNRHADNSKYDTLRYKNRSRLFVPKTRMAVRKNDASAASAMFSTADVVSVKAELESDHRQVMTARFISAALNYRLDRATRMTGPNWFLTVTGARQDAQITGICVSKQYWQFEEREYGVLVDTEEPVLDEATGEPMTDEMGMPVTAPGVPREDTEREIIVDRIMIDLIPAELCFVDTTADWRDPIQSGGFLFVGYPVRLNDLETMVRENAARPRMGGGRWRDVNVRELTKGRAAEARRNDAVRRSREQGQDRYESRFADKKGDVIWLYESFYRYNGEDWHFWMLGESMLLSDPQPTRNAYPEQKGDRPYVMGVGALETHKTHPMSPVESWQPLQQETNEITNLTLDAQKMAISPITKVLRGKNVDYKQIQNRGPDAVVFMEKPDDVTFEKAPGPDGSQQLQLNNLNVLFDEFSGTFSQSSVQTNRQLNETVGGMNLMSGSANALTEYELRIWAETWLEPCLRQCCRLIQYYESSEIVLGVAGKTAGLIVAPEAGEQAQEPGPLETPPDPGEPLVSLEEVLDGLADAQISVRVNVGIGALDPRQKLEKFGMGLKMTMESAPIIDAAGIMPNGKEIMNEVWGLLGYKDADRFFMPKPPDSGQPPPEVQKLMLEMELAKAKGELQMQQLQAKVGADKEKHELAMMEMMAEMKADREQRALEMQQMREEMRLKREDQTFDLRAKQANAAVEMRNKRESAAIDRQERAQDAALDRRAREEDHALERRHGEDSHAMSMKHADEAARQKAAAMKAAAKNKPAGKSKSEGKR